MDYAMNGGFADFVNNAYVLNFNGVAAPQMVFTSGNAITATVQPIKIGNIPDGSSNTILISEKYTPVGVDSMINEVGDSQGALISTIRTLFGSQIVSRPKTPQARRRLLQRTHQCPSPRSRVPNTPFIHSAPRIRLQ